MTVYQTQWDLAPATQTGRTLFRKQVLKRGTINYEGQRIEFDEPFLKGVVKAFKSGAYDQVPFQFADEKNRHNMDPDRFRGEVKGLELTPDGVDMIVEPTPEGAELIKKNPRLGVSARIVTDLSKSDGRRYPVAIQHVLATLDPRLTGMRPWESVDLSEDEDDDEVIDLTAAGLKKGNKVGTKTRKRTAAPQVVQIDLSALPDSAFKDLLLAAVEEGESDTDTEEVTRTTRETVKRKTPKQRRQQVIEDLEEDPDDEDLEEDDELEDDDEVVDSESEPEDDEDEDDEEDEDAEPPVAKKAKKKKSVKLSTPVRRRKVSKARRLELTLAERDWDAKKGDYIRAGVPPYLVDLATPVMSTPDKLIIDLSETGERDVDAKVVIGKLLDGVKGFVDLAPELGHGVSSVSDDKNDPTRQNLDRWTKEYGKP